MAKTNYHHKGIKAINVVEEFENISGVHLNRNKTKAMWLGKVCPRDTIKNISWCDTFVKSLGIYFCKNNNFEYGYELVSRKVFENTTNIKLLETEKFISQREDCYFENACDI